MPKHIILITFMTWFALGQIKPPEGLREYSPGVWALEGGNIFVEPGYLKENATIIIRDGLIEKVGKNIDIPKDASILDMSGKTIYPGFIDSWVETSVNKRTPTLHDSHWNVKVQSGREMSRMYQPDKQKINSLQKLGFTTAHIVPDSGIFQGQTAVIQLDEKGTVLSSKIAQAIAYEVDGWGSKTYPNALLGVVALVRQTLIDADWYNGALEKTESYPEFNEPLNRNGDLASLGNWLQSKKPFLFKTNHELSALRSFNISNEFNLNVWLKGSGYEYRRIAEIASAKPFIILPLNFPVTPDISDPNQALSYTTAELKHWEMAPENPAELIEYDIPMGFTSHGLDGKEFQNNLHRTVERSLSETDALAALTTIPAKHMGLGDRIGKIKAGYLANLTIVDGNYFKKKSELLSVWIGGEEISIKPKYNVNPEGKWNLNIGEKIYQLELKKTGKTYSGTIIQDTTKFKLSKLKVSGRFVSWIVTWDSTSGPSRFTGYLFTSTMEGTAKDDQLKWSAVRTGEVHKKEKKNTSETRTELSVLYPEGAYGWENPSLEDKTVLVQNTTIWTCGNQGVLKGYDILFKKGKVSKISKNIKPSRKAMVIDGKGKHITPGLIDCHSHSAAFSINEGTQSVTAEVRIQDVINSDDIAIYRELAGGLTMANILHGSANTIGGQNAVIKLRWGGSPGQLLYSNAVKGIKFALGENVKQSNWGDKHTTRYPQTRMGVEQLLRDAFTSAVEYKNEWKDYQDSPKKWKKKVPPKRDLELEALVEILKGERQIHCHSYRQDEILMLTRVAEDFGFTIGTFQHILEGYKVADRLKQHGAHASTFSDWWAYKYEVIDAIPYNGALMTDVGVNVSFNSDSGELARRMNTEAAKGVKYGGLSEEEALKLVTLNPAIQLGIDQWVGSLEKGKDADFVIWSEHPMSPTAICEQTWIDGVQYFSLEQDRKFRKRDRELREKLMGKILKAGGDKKGKEWKHKEEESTKHIHCQEEF